MTNHVSLNVVYVVCSFAYRVVRPVGRPNGILTSLHISSHIVFAHIGVLTFLAVRRRSRAQTKRSLCAVLSVIYRLKLVLSTILEL